MKKNLKHLCLPFYSIHWNKQKILKEATTTTTLLQELRTWPGSSNYVVQWCIFISMFFKVLIKITTCYEIKPKYITPTDYYYQNGLKFRPNMKTFQHTIIKMEYNFDQTCKHSLCFATSQKSTAKWTSMYKIRTLIKRIYSKLKRHKFNTLYSMSFLIMLVKPLWSLLSQHIYIGFFYLTF